MNKREFIKRVGVASMGATAIGAVACSSDEKVASDIHINFNKKYRWKMTTTWPPNFPVLGEGCKVMAQWVKEMSGGRMEITVFGGGELIPALEGFDAVSNGAIEMNHGAAYYWAGKLPAAPFFAAVPFGMNAQQMSSWIISGGGQALWNELYAPHNLIPLIAGSTGVQMGGWFNKEINSLQDIKGLKMRIPGLGGKVFAQAGGTPVTVAGGEIYTNLERGVIDAAEWIGPYHDYKLGLHEVAKYCYYPGWHEPGPILELLVNKEKFESLPVDLQEIIKTASYRLNQWMISEFDAKNGEYLAKIIEDKRVEIRRFPEEVLQGLKLASERVYSELIERDPWSKRVYTHYQTFRQNIKRWGDISEKVYYESIG